MKKFETPLAVQNSLWPYLFGIICLEAGNLTEERLTENGPIIRPVNERNEKLKELYDIFESYLKEWTDQLENHQKNSFAKNLEITAKGMINLCHDKTIADGKGGNSTSKTMGVFKAIMESVEHVKLDGFHDFMIACQHLENIIYNEMSEIYDAQFDSGSIKKNAIKGMAYLEGRGYYKTVSE